MNNYIPEEDKDKEDKGPWDWCRTAERYTFLLRKPGYLRLTEAREMVAIERRMGALIAHHAQGGR